MAKTFVPVPLLPELALYNIVSIDGSEPMVIVGMGYDGGNKGFFTASLATDMRNSIHSAVAKKAEMRLAFFAAVGECCLYQTEIAPLEIGKAVEKRLHLLSIEDVARKGDNRVKTIEMLGSLVGEFPLSSGSLLDSTPIVPRQSFKVRDGSRLRRLVTDRVESFVSAQGGLTAKITFRSLTVPLGTSHQETQNAQSRYAVLDDTIGVSSRPMRNVTFSRSLVPRAERPVT